MGELTAALAQVNQPLMAIMGSVRRPASYFGRPGAGPDLAGIQILDDVVNSKRA